MKFLFVTPENPYSSNDGGIASYILKISKLLIQNNHEVAILTLGDESKELEKEGVKYFIVKRNNSLFFKNKISKWLKLRSFLEAWYLYKTFKNSKLSKIVDVVQIANLNFVGLFFCTKKNDFKKIVRISTSRVLYDGFTFRKLKTYNSFYSELVEVFIMKRVDRVYSPSKFMAEYYKSKYRINVKVLRPPLLSEKSSSCKNISNVDLKVPKRYFIFVGNVSHRKGINLIVEALKFALKKEPTIEILMVGNCERKEFIRIKKILGKNNKSLIFTGVLPKQYVYPLIKGAKASILPSIVDNLPNTAIESLSLNTPVVTCKNNGVDELIIPRVNGEIFDRNSISDFAQIMVNIWRGEYSYKEVDVTLPQPLASEMTEENAIRNLIQFVK